MATSPRNHHGIQDATAIIVLVNFYPLIDETQRGLTGGGNSVTNHHRLWTLAVLDDSRRSGSLGAAAPVVLMIVGFCSMVISFSSMNRIRSHFTGVTNWSTFQPYTLYVSGQNLNLLELVAELKLLFGYSANRLARNTGFTGNFPHRHCRILLDAFFDELAVPSGVDCALSAAPRAVTCVAEPWNRLMALLH